MTLRDILPPKGQESPRRRSIPCPLRGTRSKAESREAQGGLAEAEKGASQRETQNREQCFRLFIFAVFAKAFRLKGEGFKPGEWGIKSGYPVKSAPMGIDPHPPCPLSRRASPAGEGEKVTRHFYNHIARVHPSPHGRGNQRVRAHFENDWKTRYSAYQTG